jgi:sRNA-binding protein
MNRDMAKKHVTTQLAERWPDLFDLKKPVPLAIGIYASLSEAMPDIPPRDLKDAMGYWCSRAQYLIAMTPGAKRHGLDGPQGEITEEAAKDATQRLEALKARQKEVGLKIRQAEKERQAAIKKTAEKAATETKAKTPEPTSPPADPKTAHKETKPAAPVVIVKKRRATPPGMG